jgi:hypothetical protein
MNKTKPYYCEKCSQQLRIKKKKYRRDYDTGEQLYEAWWQCPDYRLFSGHTNTKHWDHGYGVFITNKP